jgi:hypothetical protein
MRVNLVTPFSEKDQAKALGARWDAARKVWYVQDVADLTPFMRWIPDLVAASQEAAAASGGAPLEGSKQTSKAGASAAITRSAKAVPACECFVLPWEDCVHTNTRN